MRQALDMVLAKNIFDCKKNSKISYQRKIHSFSEKEMDFLVKGIFFCTCILEACPGPCTKESALACLLKRRSCILIIVIIFMIIIVVIVIIIFLTLIIPRKEDVGVHCAVTSHHQHHMIK